MQSSHAVRSLYVLRSCVAYAWVAVVVLTSPQSAAASALLLAAYAAWDGIAGFIDIRRSPPGTDVRGQRMNVAISAIAAVVIASGARFGFNVSVIAFGAWALGAGLLQLVVGLRRRSSIKGQWLMVASGAQSALAGLFFVYTGIAETPMVVALVGYAAFGATYFLLAALWLTLKATPSTAVTA